jgi:hypothetical protein
MSANSIEGFCAIIERLLDDGLGVEESAGGSPSTTPPDPKFENDLMRSIQNLQALLRDNTIVVSNAERARLFAIMDRLVKLDGKVHAHLSWFEDLSKSLGARADR